MKRQPTDWEVFAKHIPDKELISTTYIHTLTPPKGENKQFDFQKRKNFFEWTLYQKRYDCQKPQGA